MPALILLLGLTITTLGAESFVSGASRLARSLRIPPIVIGLTIVSLGTSASEIAVALSAVATDHGSMALGNIVGSNICNVLLILGIAATITPLRVAHRLVRFDIPVMAVASILALGLAAGGPLGRADGLLMLALGALYFVVVARAGWHPGDEGGEPQQVPSESSFADRRWVASLMVVGGTVLLYVGARLVVDGGTTVARAIGASELVIGLTVLAFGTSVPELAATISSLRRKERDLVVGNIVGSNIVNLLVVLGLTATASATPLSVPASLVSFDLPIATVVAFACLPIFFSGYAIERWEGIVFLGYYALYVGYVLLDQTGHAGAGLYRIALLAFVGPLAGLTLGVLVAGRRRRSRTA